VSAGKGDRLQRQSLTRMHIAPYSSHAENSDQKCDAHAIAQADGLDVSLSRMIGCPSRRAPGWPPSGNSEIHARDPWKPSLAETSAAMLSATF